MHAGKCLPSCKVRQFREELVLNAGGEVLRTDMPVLRLGVGVEQICRKSPSSAELAPGIGLHMQIQQNMSVLNHDCTRHALRPLVQPGTAPCMPGRGSWGGSPEFAELVGRSRRVPARMHARTESLECTPPTQDPAPGLVRSGVGSAGPTGGPRVRLASWLSNATAICVGDDSRS